jgi:cytochrome c-type biogenesis protein
MAVAVQEVAPRRHVLTHALMFVAGFTLVFVLLGATTGLFFGTVVSQGEIADVLVAIGGVLLIILGIHMSGAIKWLISRLGSVPALQRPLAVIDQKLDEIILPERRKQAGLDQSPGLLRSGVVGMTFAAGWTPCIGPLLGAILGLSLNAARAANPAAVVLQSAVLLLAYSVGLAIPFLLTAWVLNRATGVLRRVSRYLHVIEKVSAIFLIAVGVLLLFGTLSELNYYFQQQPEWVYQIEVGLSSYGTSLPIAFVAGLLSSFSPCVLPLIPIYLGYLTGVAVAGSAPVKA